MEVTPVKLQDVLLILAAGYSLLLIGVVAWLYRDYRWWRR
jgi:hypothetical protein